VLERFAVTIDDLPGVLVLAIFLACLLTGALNAPA
jgi:hypothetical protein